MATRRTREGPRFDHGAQYFTVRDPLFERQVDSWLQDGVVSQWDGRICTLKDGRLEWKQNPTPRYVGVPGMSAVCRHVAGDLDIRFGEQVRPPKFADGGWRVCNGDGQLLGEYDYFITSAPAPQSAELLEGAPTLQQTARRTKMHGCWATMLSFDESLELPFDGAFIHGSPLAWIARNDSKPGRGGPCETWVLHASPQWTDQYLDQEADEVLALTLDAFWRATGAERRETSFALSHRWRYAIPLEPHGSRCLFDQRLKIGACGDWCGGPRVEGAFLSGLATAETVLSACQTSTASDESE
jgi:predicted NAD/FAD-dependent oxidoreductase